MRVYTGRNVNTLWGTVWRDLFEKGEHRDSRNGEVFEFQEPVALVVDKPCERVLFDMHRRCNPFFHVMESLWMLAGRRDVDTLLRYNARMADFTDNGDYFHGAYGYRWRTWFRKDQIQLIVEELRKNPDSRRAVLAMWDPTSDLCPPWQSSDLPCNTHVYFKVTDNGFLRTTVCCRSNDLIWGALGANIVHFSYLHEYMARRLYLKVGPMTQLSDSLHMYSKVLDTRRSWVEEGSDPYVHTEAEPFHLLAEGYDEKHPFEWENEVDLFLQGRHESGYVLEDPFLATVAAPMAEAWRLHKNREYTRAIATAHCIAATDWSIACVEWLRWAQSNWEEKR